MRVLTSADWDYLLPLRNPVYTYVEFLKAVAKFPAFCGEKPADNDMSMDDVCKKEIATCISHFA